MQTVARFPYGISLYSTKLSCILTFREILQFHIVDVYFNFIVLILSIKVIPISLINLSLDLWTINRKGRSILILAPILHFGYTSGKPEMPFDGHFDAFLSLPNRSADVICSDVSTETLEVNTIVA